MTDKIRAHLDALFRDAPATRRVVEAREELLAGCLDKYADLTAAGRTPEEAYIAVISGIGDVDELLRAIERLETGKTPDREEKQRKKRSFFIAAGMFLYIAAIAAAIVFDKMNIEDLSGVAFLLISGLATFVLVYGVSSSRTKVNKPRASMSGEIQEQLAGSRDNRLLGAVTSSMWSFIVIIYLFVGLFFGWWHPGWLIFPFGSVLQILLKIALGKHGGWSKGHINALIWTACPFVYLVVSFLTERWEITWLIFPLALSLQQMWRLARVWRETDET